MSSRNKKECIRQLADSARLLFTLTKKDAEKAADRAGCHPDLIKRIEDPSAEELTSFHWGAGYPGSPVLPDSMVEQTRRWLSDIRVYLEQEHGELVCLVNSFYYAPIKDNTLGMGRQTPVEDDIRSAMNAIPIGRGRWTEGLYRVTSHNNPIWAASRQVGLAQGTGKVHADSDRLVVSVTKGLFDSQSSEKLLSQAALRIPHLTTVATNGHSLEGKPE